MIEINPAQFKLPSFPIQIEGTRALVLHPRFALFDEMGVGKSKQVIDAACILAEAGVIDTCLIVCPASVCSVWVDSELGEIQKHCWIESFAERYSSRNTELGNGLMKATKLHFIVTSYEFIRQLERLDLIVKVVKRHPTLLVLDESSFVKNHRAKQTKATLRIAEVAQRCVILNGTPIANSPMDLYSQMAMLDKGILGFKNYYAFRNRHAQMGGYMGKQIVGFYDLNSVQKKIEPHCLRRVKEDCLDLLPKVYSRIEAPLSPENWRIYKEMRDDMVAYLSKESPEAAITMHAAVKLLRLCQITSGFVGGVVKNVSPLDEVEGGVVPEEFVLEPIEPQEIGQEKTAGLLEWLEQRFAEEKLAKIIVWCRFRAEIERLSRIIPSQFKNTPFSVLQGGQGKKEREQALWLMHTENKTADPGILIAQPQAGKFGLNFTRARYAVYLSNDFNLLTRQQSEDRIHRRGQMLQTYFLDVLATGPKGQQTVDHKIAKALLKKQDLAKQTTSEWRKMLEEDF